MSGSVAERRPLLGSNTPHPDSNTAAEGHHHHNLAKLPAGRFRLLCLSIWTGTFLSALDGTIIATILTPIGSSFNASNQVSWLGTSYLLSVCVFTPVYGRLADIAGRRAAHLAAMAFFTLGTVGCALAPSMNSLIAARAVAGIGGGGINTVGVIIMTDLVDLRRRGMFQGYANIFFGLGAALGGPVGGLISDTIGWRGAFWVQPPLLVLAALGVWVNAKRTRPVDSLNPKLKADDEGDWKVKMGQVDWAGLVLLVIGVGSLLLAMSFKTSSTTPSGGEYKWSDPWIYGLLIVSALGTTSFITIEKYHLLCSRPILPLSLLSPRRRTPLGVAISNFFMTLSQFSLLYNVPLYFSTVHLDSSSLAGAHLLPNSIMICFGSLGVGWIMRRTGRYWVLTLVCSVLIVLSCLLLCFWDQRTKGWTTWVAVTPGGFGYAGVLTTSLVALMSDVTREGKGEQAVATSMSYLFRYVGQVLGVAFSSAIVQSVLQRDLARLITGPDAEKTIYTIRHSTSSIATLTAHDRAAAISAYAHALHVVFIVNLVWAVLAILGVLVIKDEAMPEVGTTKTDPSTSDEEEERRGGNDSRHTP